MSELIKTVNEYPWTSVGIAVFILYCLIIIGDAFKNRK